MTTLELAKLIGQKGVYWGQHGFGTAVEVYDVRMRYGTVDVQICPVAGSGSKWVALDGGRLILEEFHTPQGGYMSDAEAAGVQVSEDLAGSPALRDILAAPTG